MPRWNLFPLSLARPCLIRKTRPRSLIWQKKKKIILSLPKICAVATTFIYCHLWKWNELEAVKTEERMMLHALETRLTNVPSGPALRSATPGVWVQDKGLRAWSAARAFSVGIIPANSQTNVCGTANLTQPPETSSTSRLELEHKQLPNPNRALKIKTPGSASFIRTWIY